VAVGRSGCVWVGIISDGGLHAVPISTIQLMMTMERTVEDVNWLCMIAPQMERSCALKGSRKMMDQPNGLGDDPLLALPCRVLDQACNKSLNM
jgi:hypothetical protein